MNHISPQPQNNETPERIRERSIRAGTLLSYAVRRVEKYGHCCTRTWLIGQLEGEGYAPDEIEMVLSEYRHWPNGRDGGRVANP